MAAQPEGRLSSAHIHGVLHDIGGASRGATSRLAEMDHGGLERLESVRTCERGWNVAWVRWSRYSWSCQAQAEALAAPVYRTHVPRPPGQRRNVERAHEEQRLVQSVDPTVCIGGTSPGAAGHKAFSF